MDVTNDCYDCATRRGEAGEYQWWLRFVSKGCDRAIADGRFSLPVPTRFGVRLANAVRWDGLTVSAHTDAALPADMYRLRLEWQRDDRR